MRAHEKEYLASPEFRLNYGTALAWVNSYVGEYRAALGMPDSPQPPPVVDDPELRRALRNYQPVDAVEGIAAAARDRRVVMINEEHFDSAHRAFTTELLPVLRQQGFHYLAAEAFGPEIEAARYPKAGGGFTDDPVFGGMIRRALELGYSLVPYESPSDCTAADLKSFNTNGFGSLVNNNCMEGREMGQARNLARFIEAHPGEKILVHVGGARVARMDMRFGHLMALNFRELTKIDPLSVDQIFMRETSGENPDYTFIAAKYADRREPFVLRSDKGIFVPDFADGLDAAVIHPRVRYENGRPAWLSTGGWRKPRPFVQFPAYRVAIPKLRTAGDTLLQAFVINDQPDAVPVDQFLIEDPLRPAALMLPDGKYRVRIIDGRGKILVAFNIW